MSEEEPAPPPRRLAKGRLKRLKRRGPRAAGRAVPAEERAATPAPAPARAAPGRGKATAAAIAVALGLGGGGIYLATRTPPVEAPAAATTRGRAILDAVPAGALAVITADVRALRASPLAAPYLGGTRSVPGFDDVRQACGFDLIASVDELAVAIPEGHDTDFGIVATGGFADGAILDCAAKVVQARGGTPVVTTIGSFKSVRDSASQASSGETAARPGGVLLWGGGPYLRTMIDAAEGKVGSVRGGSLHETLRGELSGFETVQATYVFSDAQRAAVADEIQRAQGKAPAVLAHVTGAGLGLRLVERKASVTFVLMADDAARVAELAAWLQETKKGASSGIAAQLLGAAPLLERATVSTSGALVRVSLDATVDEIEGVVDKAIQIRAMLEKEAAPPRPAPPEPPLEAPPSASAPASAPPPEGSAPSAPSAAVPAPSASAAPRAPKRRQPQQDPLIERQ